MKALRLFIAVLVLTICIPMLSNGDELSELKGKKAVLESMWVQVMNEGQEVAEQARPVFADADKILSQKKDDSKLTVQEKLKIAIAAFYEQMLTKLAYKAKLIEAEMYICELRAEKLLKEKKRQS